MEVVTREVEIREEEEVSSSGPVLDSDSSHHV